MFLISNLEIGGAQEIVRTLSEYFLKVGVNPVVCAFQDGSLHGEIERLGIPVEILPGRQHSVLAFPFFVRDMMRIRRDLLAVVDKYGINIIQTQLLRGLDFLVLTLRFSRKLLVFWTIHNVRFILREEHLPRFKWLLCPKRWVHRLLYRMGARWVNGVIVIAGDVREAVLEYLGNLNGKVVLIINSVDIPRYQRPVDRKGIRRELGIDEQIPVMALVATFKTQKGHRYLIDAAPTVLEKFSNLHFLFIGDGELREQLKMQVQSLHLENHFHFLGIRNDVSDLLGASDYFVLPSLWEGLPMALVEAMARGLPVIATDVSGTKEVMVDGETGILIEPGNVQQLAAAMIRLLSDPKQAKTMGIAGQNRVTVFFSADRQASEYLALYREQWNSIYRT